MSWLFVIGTIGFASGQTERNPFELQGETTIPKQKDKTNKNPFELDSNEKEIGSEPEIQSEINAKPQPASTNPLELEAEEPEEVQAQKSNQKIEGNPFELKSNDELEEQVSSSEAASNPFDLKNKKKEKIVVESEVIKAPVKKTEKKGFLQLANLLVLCCCALVFSVFNGNFQTSLKGFLNENMLNQLYRDEGNTLSMGHLFMQLTFVVTCGSLIYILAVRNSIELPFQEWKLWFISCIIFAGLVYLKQFVLFVFGQIFSLKQSVGKYILTVSTFNVFIGLAMVPILVVLTFSTEPVKEVALLVGLGIIGILLIYKTIRLLFLSGSFLSFHKFHFFLYLCAFELAPLLVLLKLGGVRLIS